MRRKDRLISNTETSSILEKGEYGVLGTVSSNNVEGGGRGRQVAEENYDTWSIDI